MTADQPTAEVPASKPRRWPLAILIAFLAGVVGAVLAIPVSDWAMRAHHVSSMEGGRACAAVGIFAPLGFVAGVIVGFVIGLTIPGTGFVGYLKRQIIALVAIAALVFAVGGIGYATADHPPVVDGQNLALEIEVRVPTNGRSIEELKAADFDVALVVSASDRAYSDMRWSEATRTDEFITVPAWALLRSSNAGREITAGVRDENRQIFNVLRTASPKIDEAWSEWAPPRERFDHSKPATNEQYFVRYRVRPAAEYSPTPRPEMEPAVSPLPEESPTPPGDGTSS